MATPFTGFVTGPPAPTGPLPSTPGAPATAYSPAYGGVPQVPNLIDIYGTTTAANQQFLPQFTRLGSEITAANQQELLNNLRAAIPGYDASVAQSMGNIGALQKGQIPDDVLNLLKQQSAERGVATGLYDSPNANAALLRSLGLTSLGLEQQGEQEMGALIGRTPQAQPFDISQLLMSPSDLYQSQLLANIYASSPQPAAAAQQLIRDQLAGYGLGRSNVPSYNTGRPTPAAPYTATASTGGGGAYPTTAIPADASVVPPYDYGGYGDIAQTMVQGGIGTPYQLPDWLTNALSPSFYGAPTATGSTGGTADWTNFDEFYGGE